MQHARRALLQLFQLLAYVRGVQVPDINAKSINENALLLVMKRVSTVETCLP